MAEPRTTAAEGEGGMTIALPVVEASRFINGLFLAWEPAVSVAASVPTAHVDRIDDVPARVHVVDNVPGLQSDSLECDVELAREVAQAVVERQAGDHPFHLGIRKG